jgi:predicted DNA-binding protein (MmcQ/YjbR family)
VHVTRQLRVIKPPRKSPHDYTPAARFERPVERKLRAICLALPETTEKTSWGHPNFRAGKRTFAAFEIFGGRPSIAFRLPPAEVTALLRRKRFFATPYGRNLWVSLRVDGAVDWRLVDALLRRSYRTVAIKRMVIALDKYEVRSGK